MRVGLTVRHGWRDERGATAVETAFVLPVFLIMLFGIVNTALLAGAVSGLRFAVEEAARCYAVNQILCPTTAATRSLAAQRYQGPNVGATFVASDAGCGHTVIATAQFDLDIIVRVFHIPLTAAACYPGVSAT